MYFLIILGILFLLLLFLIFPSPRRHKDREILKGLQIAHRGLHNLFKDTPESSLAAIKRAVDLGFAVEIDIHITADGEVIAFHDSETERMCGVSGNIEDMTLEEIKKLRLVDTDESIPTLKECLELINGRVPIMIELKCGYTLNFRLCRAADKILKNYQGKYFIQSFSPHALLWYRIHRPDICRGQLSSGNVGPEIYKKMLGWLVFDFLSRPDFISYEHEYAKKPIRKLVTKLGAFPVGWTFRSQEEINLGKNDFQTFIFENFIPDK